MRMCIGLTVLMCARNCVFMVTDENVQKASALHARVVSKVQRDGEGGCRGRDCHAHNELVWPAIGVPASCGR